MNNLIRSSLIWITLATTPLNTNTSILGNTQKNEHNKTEIELLTNLSNSKSDCITLNGNIESINAVPVDSKLVIDAMMKYFDEEVKLYTLSPKAGQQLIGLVNSYLASHPILKIGNKGEVFFVIDDKQAFSQMVKQFANIIIEDMPSWVQKIVIPLFFGGKDAIQNSLDNLDYTVMEMKERQYKDVVFDYIGGIIKRVVASTKGNMKIGKYYDNINSYYPNKNSGKIRKELINSGLYNKDMKNLKYPFKK